MPGLFSTLAIAAVLLLAVAYQTILRPLLTTGGIFRQVQPLNNQDCKTVPELAGCEKMVLHRETATLYLACSKISNRVHWLPALDAFNVTGMATDDYVAAYDLATRTVTYLSLADNAPARGLSVHGMDVVSSSSDPAELFLYLVNHRPPVNLNAEGAAAQAVGADSVVEIFRTRTNVGEGEDRKLEHVATVEDPSVIITPNDIVGSPDGKTFWFTNDHGVRVGFSRTLETYLRRATTSVGHCHVDHGCKFAAQNLPGANGIARGRNRPDSNHNDDGNETFYVGSANGKGIRVFERQADDTLVLGDVIDLGGLPADNLAIDEDGALWAAVFPKAVDQMRRAKDASMSLKVASSAYRITLNTAHSSYFGEKYKVERMFEDDGTLAIGSTSAVYSVEHRTLFLHGVLAPHLTICKI